MNERAPSAGPGPVLEALQVSSSYGGADVIHQVDLAVPRGGFVGLVGPNASGKSTLVRTLSRVLRPRRGQVLLDGRDLYRQRPESVARMMAVVEQELPADLSFTVEEVVLLGRLPHLGRSRREGAADLEVANRAMRTTSTLSLSGRVVGELSGGERQRVALARALAQEPSVLLLDEPTAHLDPGHQLEVLDLLRRLNLESSLTVVIVLHDLNLAALYCRELALMAAGRVLSHGTPREVLTSDNLRKAYGPGVALGTHAVTGDPQVTLVPGAAERAAEPAAGRRRVHVVGGGGSSGSLIEALTALGYSVSAGVLNVGDSDWRLAKALGVTMVAAPPFSAIPEDAVRRNRDLMWSADVVIVTDVPFGYGNLANLTAALEAGTRGGRVVLIDKSPIAERDYTSGQAARSYEALRARAAAVVGSELEVIDFLAGG